MDDFGKNVSASIIDRKTITDVGLRVEWSVDVLWGVSEQEEKALEEAIRSRVLLEDFQTISDGILYSIIAEVFDENSNNVIPCSLTAYSSPIENGTYRQELYSGQGKLVQQRGVVSEVPQGQFNYYYEDGEFDFCAWFENGTLIASEATPEALMQHTNVKAANLLRDVDFPSWEDPDTEYGLSP